MCGILGIISLSNRKPDASKFRSALNKINHRGPDSNLYKSLLNGNIIFGHTRLSILDLTEEGNQPFQYGNYTIIYNGEIYNYIEIRKILEEKGYLFKTETDTEVLLAAYDFYGSDCVKHFNGMWAFAIFNSTTNKVFISRDRFGVKPLYYYQNEDYFIFSSEIKSIVEFDSDTKKPDLESIFLYVLQGQTAELNKTWFSNVFRLMPGHSMEISALKISMICYYDYNFKKFKGSFDEAKAEFLEKLKQSINYRMRSDVPVGITLSSGLDSTAIAATLHNLNYHDINSFTVGFNDKVVDESQFVGNTISKYGLNGNILVSEYNPEDYFSVLRKSIHHLEAGSLSTSIVPVWKLYEMANRKVRVLLEGQGSDEIFGGYYSRFVWYYIIDQIKSLNILNALSEIYYLIIQNSFLESIKLFIRTFLPLRYSILLSKIFLPHLQIIKNVSISKIGNKKVSKNYDSSLRKALIESHKTTLANLLHYGDSISMAHSIESRMPFLDVNIVEFALSLPSNFLIGKGKGKLILREALKDIIPFNIYSSKIKTGFSSDIIRYVHEEIGVIRAKLLSEKAVKRNIFNEARLKELLYKKKKFNISEIRFIYRLLSTELWFEEYIDK
jgi:asparagine synthase (glutamine-hydrolysing)